MHFLGLLGFAVFSRHSQLNGISILEVKLWKIWKANENEFEWNQWSAFVFFVGKSGVWCPVLWIVVVKSAKPFQNKSCQRVRLSLREISRFVLLIDYFNFLIFISSTLRKSKISFELLTNLAILNPIHRNSKDGVRQNGQAGQFHTTGTWHPEK